MGLHTAYRINDLVNVTCLFGPLKGTSLSLNWYMNGTKVRYTQILNSTQCQNSEKCIRKFCFSDNNPIKRPFTAMITTKRIFRVSFLTFISIIITKIMSSRIVHVALFFQFHFYFNCCCSSLSNHPLYSDYVNPSRKTQTLLYNARRKVQYIYISSLNSPAKKQLLLM